MFYSGIWLREQLNSLSPSRLHTLLQRMCTRPHCHSQWVQAKVQNIYNSTDCLIIFSIYSLYIYKYICIYCAVSPVYVSLQCILLFALILFIAVVDLVVVYCFNHSLWSTAQWSRQINTRLILFNHPIRVFLTVYFANDIHIIIIIVYR